MRVCRGCVCVLTQRCAESGEAPRLHLTHSASANPDHSSLPGMAHSSRFTELMHESFAHKMGGGGSTDELCENKCNKVQHIFSYLIFGIWRPVGNFLRTQLLLLLLLVPHLAGYVMSYERKCSIVCRTIINATSACDCYADRL